MYLMRVLDDETIIVINEIRIMADVGLDTWPEEWMEKRNNAQCKKATALWLTHLHPPPEPDNDDEVFEMWFE